MFDVASYEMGVEDGYAEGKRVVTLSGDEYTFSDPGGDGHITVAKTEGNDE